MNHEQLHKRYGATAPTLTTPPALTTATDTSVWEGLLAHRSVRHYRPDPLPAGTLEWLIAAAQSASTSSNLQTWSVIALQDPQHKSEAATLCGDQDFIRQAPLLLVFCADLSRLTFVSETSELPGEGLEFLEMFLMASLDASLAAQNTVVAAEALGLGICYVGGARNSPRELAALLHLPSRVFAVFGLAVGWPAADDTSAVKPRLPQAEVLHHETYSTEQRAASIEAYNATMQAFYQSQNMPVRGDWAQHSARRVATVEALSGRHLLRQILQEQGFGLK
jgi:nitroreductase